MILLKSSILGAIGNEQKCKIEIVNIHSGNKSESLECNCNISPNNRFSAYIAEEFLDLIFSLSGTSSAFWDSLQNTRENAKCASESASVGKVEFESN